MAPYRVLPGGLNSYNTVCLWNQQESYIYPDQSYYFKDKNINFLNELWEVKTALET